MAFILQFYCRLDEGKRMILYREPNRNGSRAFVLRFRTKTILFRVWTQFNQHLKAKRWSMAIKFWSYFSKRVESLRMSFILQKKRSAMLRIA